MEKLLFVNACIRGEGQSRTLQLCRAFLQEYCRLHPDTELQEVDVSRLGLLPLDVETLASRDALQDGSGDPKALFPLAQQFAEADKILIGAPYWDLSFPTALKAYVEHISIYNVTFEYTGDRPSGLCKASKMLYATTSGSKLFGANFGFDYFKGLCKQFDIAQCELLSAEGLDMPNADVAAIMQEGLQQAKIVATDF